MTSRTSFVSEAILETQNFESGIRRMLGELTELQTRMQALGQGGSAESMGKFVSAQEAAIERAKTAINALIQRYELLREIQGRLGTQKSITISPEEQQALAGLGGRDRRVQAKTIENQISKAQVAIEAETLRLQDAQVSTTERLAKVKEDVARWTQTIIRDQVNSVISGERENQIVRKRLQYLEEQRQKLLEQRAIVESQVAAQLGTRAGGRLERNRDSINAQLEASLEKRERLIRRVEAAQDQLANASTDKKREKAQERINFLLERERATAQRIVSLREQLSQRPGAPAAALEQAAIESGAIDELQRIDSDIEKIDEATRKALVENLELSHPRFKQLQNELSAIQTQLNKGTLTTEEENRLLDEQARKLQEINAIEADAITRGVTPAFDPEAFRQQQFANMKFLERTFSQAFDDMGRRFTATLQFAVSGALIFGVQRFVREFAEAAIDVERTFADISSALEFDLSDEGIERGTAAFDRRIESFRRDVIDLSNEFNVLPEVANKSAFQMIARFGETGNAIKAVRAQLLATKVATIDQGEALRALTATAEGFAAAVLESNDHLTFQERLLERERVAAEGYTAALDEAVYIQQRFGIEVEDTLEGTARAAETFRQLGFTRQQTEATVAAVAFQLGQTGQNVAERLNRAFAGITQPEVRDALLDLAAASETFKLSVSDFDSGAGAIETIDKQIRRLQEVEPGTALGIRDILGQRRETEVVAAFFGTADLRKAIETSLVGAAGAAERRFSFLQATVSEQIQSILVKFQEMAQLFERIGGLTPFKLLIAGAETFLSSINAILKAAQTLFEGLDKIGEAFGVKLGSDLQKILSIVLAINAGLAIFSGAAAAFRIATATQAGVQAAQAVAAAGGVGAGAKALDAAMTAMATRQVAQTAGIMGKFGAGMARLGTEVKASTSLFGKLGVVLLGAIRGIGVFFVGLTRGIAGLFAKIPGVSKGFGTIAAIAIELAAGLYLFYNAIQRGAETGREAGIGAVTAERDARIAADRQDRISGFESETEKELFRLEQTISNLTAQSQETVRSGFSTWIASTLPYLDSTMREELGGFWQALRANGLGAPDIEPDTVVGSKEWWDKTLDKARKDFLVAQHAAIQESLSEAAAREGLGDVINIPDPFQLDFQDPLAWRVPDQFQEAQGALNAALRQMNEASTDEEFQAAQAAMDRATELWLNIKDGIDATADSWEGSLTGIRTRLENIQSGVEAGRISPKAAPLLIDRELTNLRRLQRDVEQSDWADKTERLAEIQNDIDKNVNNYAQSVLAAFQDREADIELIGDPVRQLEARLAMLLQQYRLLGKNLNTAEARQVMRDIRATQLELADAAGDAAIELAQQNVALARTTDEWVQAMNELNRSLDVKVLLRFMAQLRQLDFTNLFDLAKLPGMIRDLMQDLASNDFQQAQNDQEVADRLLDEAQRRASATVRLANPIRSRIAEVQSRIASLNVLLTSGTLAGVELMEAQIAMQEALADRVEAEQERVAAYIKMQAGHADQLSQLRADLTIVAEQLDFTAQAYGELSAEYSNLAASQDRLQYELVQAMLALEDLERRLGSDITNDFEQAQLDLVAVLAELANAGDLGELEKAQLELKKAQAEAAAEKAFFDDRLFQLRFAFETGALSLEGYKAALQRLLESVDTSTQQGRETFLQIQSIIEGLAGDLADLSFNIPGEIRLPTLFEVRRALAADQLGVNYMDNRQVEVNVAVTSVADLEQVLQAIDDAFGESALYQYSRSAPGGSGIYAGGF